MVVYGKSTVDFMIHSVCKYTYFFIFHIMKIKNYSFQNKFEMLDRDD
jgi:hypothetical protein